MNNVFQGMFICRVFLVRDSSVAGGFVISVTAANKNIHSQVLPVKHFIYFLFLLLSTLSAWCSIVRFRLFLRNTIVSIPVVNCGRSSLLDRRRENQVLRLAAACRVLPTQLRDASNKVKIYLGLNLFLVTSLQVWTLILVKQTFVVFG